MIAYDAVVLAGGAARRLGGVDKPMTAVAGVPMLVGVLSAVSNARSIVVVGPRRELPQFGDRLSWTREDPPGGGPVAALAAGVAVLASPAPLVMVLAADLPFVHGAIGPLLDAAASSEADGAVLVDRGGHDQPLAAAYRREPLLHRLATLGAPGGAAVRELVGPMRLVRVRRDDAAFDCDTWDDIRHANERATRRTR